MKRMLCACMAALLLSVTVAPALAEYDFSGLTLEELYDVRARVDEAIATLEAGGDERYYEEGSYLVGADLPEGDYVLFERENAMFASVVVRSGDSSESALILHKLISGQADIHLTKDTWVTCSVVRSRPLAAATEPADADTVQDKAPLSSYSIYSGIPGTDAQLTKFEILHRETELSVSDGDYIELSGCVLSAIE